MPPRSSGVAFSSATFDASGLKRVASPRVQLLPAGSFRALDGRPAEVDAWILDAAGAAELIQAAQARSTPYVLDYEHQSLVATDQGIKAPAAGWFKTLEWVDGVGLFATDVAWTEAARALIEADEYRYVSPVFSWDRDSGRVTGLLNAAITNTPGLDGLSGVAELIAARLALSLKADPMDELLERLRYFLNLPITATADECVAELNKLISQIAGDGMATARDLLARAGETAALRSEIATARAAAPDPAQWVPLTVHAALQQEIATLQNAVDQRARNELLTAALADGRILPATQAYWGSQPLEALVAYLEVAQPIAALTGQQSVAARQGATAGQAAAGDYAVPAGFRVDPDRLRQHQRALALMRDQNLTYAAAAAAAAAG